MQTRYLGVSRLSFEPRLFLKCTVPLGEKWLMGKKCKGLECGQNGKTGNRVNILQNIRHDWGEWLLGKNETEYVWKKVKKG